MSTKEKLRRPKGGATLEDLRKRIDEINLKLVALFNQRARLAQQIGRLKHHDGAPIYQPVRERQVLDRVVAHNPGPLSGDHLRRIFQEIISACTALEHALRIAYLGPEHTYSHEAARNRFGASAAFAPEPSIAAVFQALENQRADYGVVPVENSTEGSVSLTLDLLIDTPLCIIGEIMLPIRHALMARADAGGFKKIVSHQQSLGQCRNYLAANYPNCELEAVPSNSLAAQKAAAPLGAGFTFICLVTGSLWGKPMWGTYWVWDARLTSVLVLFILYLGLIALWRAIDDPGRAARAAAILTLVGAVDLPIIKFSVDWWNTLHQPASVFRLDGPTIAPELLMPLIVMSLAFTGLFLTLHVMAIRNEILRRRIARVTMLAAVKGDRLAPGLAAGGA